MPTTQTVTTSIFGIQTINGSAAISPAMDVGTFAGESNFDNFVSVGHPDVGDMR
jgi:hypothetical protein